jgi:5-methylcytosine-specific restriction enzyme B
MAVPSYDPAMAEDGPPSEALRAAAESFDPGVFEQDLALYKAERAQLLERFPEDTWPAMTLEQYAQGTPQSAHSYCLWLERKATNVGSIRGGSAKKLLIYKRRQEEGWYFPNQFADEQEAWETIRSAFVQALRFARDDRWEDIEPLDVLGPGSVLVKTLHVYFPERVLPVSSADHLRHFLAIAGQSEAKGSPLALNRELLGVLRGLPPLEGLSTKLLERFLYSSFPPDKAPTVLKVAPGEGAHNWDACRSAGQIRVGWPDLGDLTEYETILELKEAFREAYPDDDDRTATGLLKFRDLKSGDLVIANRGIAEVLAVGTVQGPGYGFAPEDDGDYPHIVPVAWDPTKAKRIPKQAAWRRTIVEVPARLQPIVLGEPVATVEDPLEAHFERIEAALERKGQVIVYGPPGTGKTYVARRFIEWWAEKEGATSSEAPPQTGRVWWLVARPDRWSWEELFPDGRETFEGGNIARNWGLVAPGDLVLGYEARPTKRITAVARVERAVEPGSATPSIVVRPVAQVTDGPTFEELRDDPILRDSEPMRNACRGTIFKLDAREASHLLALLQARDPSLEDRLPLDDSSVERQISVTFHPSYGYEDFIEGFRPVPGPGGTVQLRLEDGVFKRVCLAAAADPGRRYVVLVDEINRGNVAKILGELISLLELDKRGELRARLPQSGDSFTVPKNVYVIGTMNTADRSIRLLDAALRRRFAFIELMPDPGLLAGDPIEELSLDSFLTALNATVVEQAGREKQIGHSYFFRRDGSRIESAHELAVVVREEIIPLLQEYAYEDYGKLAKYLGEDLVEAESRSLAPDVYDDEKLIAALVKRFGSDDAAPEAD